MSDHPNRRRILFSVLSVALLPRGIGAAFADDEIGDGKLVYRGFTLDVSAVQQAVNFPVIEESAKHQFDIAADCGAKPEIIDLFRTTNVRLMRGLRGNPGRFSPNHGIDIEAAVMPPQEPIVLHELLHAFHFTGLPDGMQNPDVLLFYRRAKENQLYPAKEYLLTNPSEFFAVTASLYLWGNVDREPHTREKLKATQPIYYEWLGEQFGVQK